MRCTILFLLLLTVSCQSQNNSLIIGGGCDGCELMYADMPDEIYSSHTSMAWSKQGQNLLITGKIFQLDGKTPAKDVIVYYWQTNEKGIYPTHESLNSKTKRHGYIRGWIKSDENGHYEIRTIKPRAYPKSHIPAHIHFSVKEPQLKDEYYVDELVFDYDPLLTTIRRKKLENRGGSGVLRSLKSNGLIIAEHNIILGLNIPNYPTTIPNIQSGQAIGEDFQSITPYHVWGPDKDTNTCPVCRYGKNLGIMYFVNDFKSLETIKWTQYLDEQDKMHSDLLKTYLIYAPRKEHNIEGSKLAFKNLGKRLNLSHIALTTVPSFSDKESDVYLAKINPDVANTFIIYKNRNIVNKYINLLATKENFEIISDFVNNNINEYMKLPIDTRRR